MTSHVASHGALLLQRLHQQREDGVMCDVTVAVRDAEFRAHRSVLAAFSPYFNVYFSTQTADKGQGVMSLDADMVSRYALEKLLEFIYTGEMSSLVSDNLATVRSAAVFLGMAEATLYLEESPEHTKPSNESKSELEMADLQAYNASLHKEEEVADVEEDSEVAEQVEGKEGWRAMDLSVNPDWTERGNHDHEDLDETGKGKKVLTCEVCGLSFTETCNLQRHMKIHSEIMKPFQCVFCSKSFRQSNQLKSHMRIHTGEKPYVCDVCGQAFAQSSTLTYHKRRHTGEKPYQCDTCGMSFSVSSTLFAHARRVHGLKFAVEASTEQERWSSSLVQEEPQHEERSSSLVHVEPQPPQHEERSSSLVHVEPQPPQHEERSSSLVHVEPQPPQHEERSSSLVHVEPQPPQIKDEQEVAVVVVQEELDPPQIKQEPEELPLRPEETGQSTLLLQVKSEDDHRETEPQASTSTEHMQTQAYIQSWLPSQPTTVTTLSSRCSESENPYTCTICGRSFSENSNLRRHMRTHTGEKPYTCAFCGKGCSQMSELQTHMRIHTGEKPFICPVCGKGCSERGSLKKHMRAHTGERPFICNVCGKGFGQTGNLKTHMRIHTGERPFNCNVCGKEFAQKGSLKSHMRTHKGVENL